MTIESLIEEIEKLDAGTTKKAAENVVKKMYYPPSDGHYEWDKKPGCFLYQLAEAIETEFRPSLKLLPLCAKLLKVYGDYASPNAWSPNVYADMRAKLNAALERNAGA